jgi:hypothetical protein
MERENEQKEGNIRNGSRRREHGKKTRKDVGKNGKQEHIYSREAGGLGAQPPNYGVGSAATKETEEWSKKNK